MSFQLVLEVVALTDPGRVRAHNEDAVDVVVDLGLVILADGMGGYNAGEIASKMTVDIIKNSISKKFNNSWTPEFIRQSALLARWLEDAIQLANSEVITASENNAEYAGMGTTVVAGIYYQDNLVIAHVGDSRAYRFRNGVLEQLTHDHSVLQAQIDAGLISAESAQYSPIKNLITRAVGAQYDIDVEIRDYQTHADDLYLFCSDGLSDMLLHEDIYAIISNYSSQLDQCAQVLVDSANANGGRDNISVILLRINEMNKRTLLNRLFPN